MNKIRTGSIINVNYDDGNLKKGRVISIDKTKEIVGVMILNDFVEDDHIEYVSLLKISRFN